MAKAFLLSSELQCSSNKTTLLYNVCRNKAWQSILFYPAEMPANLEVSASALTSTWFSAFIMFFKFTSWAAVLTSMSFPIWIVNSTGTGGIGESVSLTESVEFLTPTGEKEQLSQSIDQQINKSLGLSTAVNTTNLQVGVAGGCLPRQVSQSWWPLHTGLSVLRTPGLAPLTWKTWLCNTFLPTKIIIEFNTSSSDQKAVMQRV